MDKTLQQSQEKMITLNDVLETKRKKHKQLKKRIETHKRLTQRQNMKIPRI